MLLQEGGDPNMNGRDGSVPLMVCLVPLINKDLLFNFTHNMKVRFDKDFNEYFNDCLSCKFKQNLFYVQGFLFKLRPHTFKTWSKPELLFSDEFDPSSCTDVCCWR